MSEESAFLRAIWTAPAAVEPWLVYADWLDEQGDPFGEDGRRVWSPPADRAAWDTWRRQCYEQWLALPTHDGPGYWLIENREFARELGEQIVASRPVMPWLRNRFDKLRDPRAAAALAVCPLLEQLTALDLCYTRLTGDGVAALAASPHLRHLDSLNLSWNDLRDTGAVALANSPHLASLRRLDLGYCGIGSTGAQALAGSPHLTWLAWLNLDTNPLITDADERALVRRFGEKVCRF
jgi:uncharacterized protein (TIGR02996 family)